MIVMATRSEGKLRELRPMFAGAGLAAVDLGDLDIHESPDEDGLEIFDTFEENALAKARYFARRCGLATIADDSGLEVLALQGRPGVRSKRYCGRDDLRGQDLDDANNAKLLGELAAFQDRRARYVCVAVFVGIDGAELVQRGETAGIILPEPRGGSGFGYDPYFLSDELGRTFGEADASEKERVSHRGRAFSALLGAIAKVDRGGPPR
jgi:XTP/dITP diphosphohydrolase